MERNEREGSGQTGEEYPRITWLTARHETMMAVKGSKYRKTDAKSPAEDCTGHWESKKTGNVTVRQQHAREKEHYQAKGKKALPVLFLCQWLELPTLLYASPLIMSVRAGSQYCMAHYALANPSMVTNRRSTVPVTTIFVCSLRRRPFCLLFTVDIQCLFLSSCLFRPVLIHIPAAQNPRIVRSSYPFLIFDLIRPF